MPGAIAVDRTDGVDGPVWRMHSHRLPCLCRRLYIVTRGYFDSDWLGLTA